MSFLDLSGTVDDEMSGVGRSDFVSAGEAELKRVLDGALGVDREENQRLGTCRIPKETKKVAFLLRVVEEAEVGSEHVGHLGRDCEISQRQCELSSR